MLPADRGQDTGYVRPGGTSLRSVPDAAGRRVARPFVGAPGARPGRAPEAPPPRPRPSSPARPSPELSDRGGLCGYTEGQNIIVEHRHAAGRLDQIPKLAAELIALGVDVLVVGGTVSAQSTKAVTSTIPIVFTLAGDPVGSGLVASLAQPGGNATGLSNLAAELSGKQLEILKAARPQTSRIGVLYNPVNPANRVALEEARVSARTLAVELQALEIRQPNELARAFSLLKTRGVRGRRSRALVRGLHRRPRRVGGHLRPSGGRDASTGRA